MSNVKIMTVDDDNEILYAFREVVTKDGYISIEARDGIEALEKAESEPPDLIFMDITMPNLDGLEALGKIKENHPNLPIVIITGQGTVQRAIKAMQLGAFDYLPKPISIAKVRELINRALSDNQNSISDTKRFRGDTGDRYQLIGNSATIQEVYKMIGTISLTPNHTPVLITGESGTGKELVARAIHNNGSFPDEPFVPVNCSALPETLLESELFGYEKGAFTGAITNKQGRFEAAHNGTIFLDEIGDLSGVMQQKLLRVLQEREFERLGSNKPLTVEARIIAATNQDILSRVEQGIFREDLFYRLNVAIIHLPPLRDHKEDIELLASFFLERFNQLFRKNIKGFSKEAMVLLKMYSYPGNIRELENLIERAVMLSRGEVILPDVLKKMFHSTFLKSTYLPIVSSVFSESREHLLNVFEKQFVIEQLGKHNSNVSAAARASKMSRQNFYRLMEKHKIGGDNLQQESNRIE